MRRSLIETSYMACVLAAACAATQPATRASPSATPAEHSTAPAVAAAPPAPRPSHPSWRQPPWIGVMFENRTTTRIKTLLPAAPGERAGLQIGDEIISVDGERVTSGAEVSAAVQRHKPGQQIVLAVSRASKTVEIPVTLEERTDPGTLARDALLDHPAPAFDLPIVVGSGSARLADLKGSVVVVDFWATWCGPCRLVVPHLNELVQKSPQLHVIGISNDALADIRDYASEMHVAYTLASDADAQVQAAYLGSALPMLVVIDKTGVVRLVELGVGDTAALDELIARLLQ